VKNEVKKTKKITELGHFENSSEMEVYLYFIKNLFQYAILLDSAFVGKYFLSIRMIYVCERMIKKRNNGELTFIRSV
jgi:hypothetical protein